jgi:hypothetical protein
VAKAAEARSQDFNARLTKAAFAYVGFALASLAQRSCVSYLERGTRCSVWRAQMRPPSLLSPLVPRCIEVILKSWKASALEQPCRMA